MWRSHPNSTDCQDTTSSASMVICSKHEHRQAINTEVQDLLLPNADEHHLIARDYDFGGSPLALHESKVIYTLKSVLPQILTVKEGSKVMITRNLDLQANIVNGTIGHLKAKHNNVLMVQKLFTDKLIPVTR